ncbi:unnamed protein product [Soboliphyme baturini]|uniref:Uncharacterized protein n=1 Tax=Soboliphyme baturini TaxID=241478 RepID=A0A183IQV6_9BILA|nr:unnamed protein product [Soboliphyme baturini]
MEYLQCSYSPKLMAEVREMASDLTEERFFRRKAIVDKLFPKKGDAAVNETSPISVVKKSKYSDSVAVDAEVVKKQRVFELLKAELTITPGGMSPMDTFNHACNRTKYTWNMEWNGSYCKLLVSCYDIL